MIEGKLNGDKKMLILNSKSQQGKGVEVVSPLQQTLDIAKARIKRKRASSKQQSSPKRRRKRTAPKKKTSKKNINIKKRRKTARRKR